jgi:AraC-like DNA-binding protein
LLIFIFFIQILRNQLLYCSRGGYDVENFFIEHIVRSGHYTMTQHHFHELYEIYYLIDGERNYFIKDRTYRLGAGEIVFIDKLELHKTSDTGTPDHERILLQFHEDFLNMFQEPLLFHPFKTNTRVIKLSPTERQVTEKILKQLLNEQSVKAPGYQTSIQTLLVQILIRAGRWVYEQPTSSFVFSTPLHKKLSEIVDFINEQYMNPINLKGVAAAHYISPYYLSRKFKEMTGFSFVEYINSVRIKEAQKLLRDTNLKVTKIAEQVGFDNISNFGRVFKQIAHINPLEYRKSIKPK